MNHSELREKALKKSRVQRAFRLLEPEYALLRTCSWHASTRDSAKQVWQDGWGPSLLRLPVLNEA